MKQIFESFDFQDAKEAVTTSANELKSGTESDGVA
jgi:hypothetical protein